MMLDRWRGLMECLGLPRSEDTFAALVAAYAEPHRQYHTIVHVKDALVRLDAVRASVSEPEEAALCLWFHDAVYRIGSATNEADSAEWAGQFLCAAGLGAARAAKVRSFVVATTHTNAPPTDTAAWVMDIDLAILGGASEEYAAYSEAIRREYSAIPEATYRAKRRQILEALLARPRIYYTGRYHNAFEMQARANIRREIAVLAEGCERIKIDRAAPRSIV